MAQNCGEVVPLLAALVTPHAVPSIHLLFLLCCTRGSNTASKITSKELLLKFPMFVRPKYSLVAI